MLGLLKEIEEDTGENEIDTVIGKALACVLEKRTRYGYHGGAEDLKDGVPVGRYHIGFKERPQN